MKDVNLSRRVVRQYYRRNYLGILDTIRHRGTAMKSLRTRVRGTLRPFRVTIGTVRGPTGFLRIHIFRSLVNVDRNIATVSQGQRLWIPDGHWLALGSLFLRIVQQVFVIGMIRASFAGSRGS